ncbi:uncharacterized protein PAC_04950 [Phialocephala subalpina]|uniref:Protein kinase domain-containing protein n=1 Tax=Phialocephala subalpina TaxID=576137 RepID=A0A1L7WQL3_9HELO|nr:uncharacterized protein PAC_04950 [Phialocephala subalpina]
MAAPVIDDAFLGSINYWRNYRGEQNATLKELQAYYRIHPYAAAPLQNIVPQVVPLLGQAQAATPYVSPVALSAAKRQRFLRNNIINNELPATEDPLNWRGTKILGDGGHGIVGLWEYQGNADPPPTERQVAVKQLPAGQTTNPQLDNLAFEENFLLCLYQYTSAHIVRILFPSTTIIGANEGRHQPFSEVTLWLLFKCLIDGISIMENAGAEFTIARDGKTASTGLPKDEIDAWDPIVHFDIKPDNYFLQGRDFQHAATPLIGDFGHAKCFPRNAARDEAAMMGLRKKGTDGYFAPEARFRSYLPHHRTSSERNSYGADLEATTYSAALRGTIFKCLYHNRNHRPSLKDLKVEITQNITAAFKRGSKVDAWTDFELPEPPNPVAPGGQVPGPFPVMPAPPAAPAGFNAELYPQNLPPPIYPTTCGCILRYGPRRGGPCGRPCRGTAAEITINDARCTRHAKRVKFPRR